MRIMYDSVGCFLESSIGFCPVLVNQHDLPGVKNAKTNGIGFCSETERIFFCFSVK